jgi:hypothetical protein
VVVDATHLHPPAPQLPGAQKNAAPPPFLEGGLFAPAPAAAAGLEGAHAQIISVPGRTTSRLAWDGCGGDGGDDLCGGGG